MTWISTFTGYGIHTIPNVQFETPREMFNLAYDCKTNPNWCEEYLKMKDDSLNPAVNNILALYNKETKTVILRKDWNAKSIKNRSILVHELVHHMQNEEEFKGCKGIMEEEAYDVQNAWLKQYKMNIFDTLGLGKLYYSIIISCGHM